jgi:hypothetical protein
LAYLEKNRAEVTAAPPKPVINQDVIVILHTQLIERNQKGRYDMEVILNRDELAKKMIKHGQLAEKDRTSYGGWGQYNDPSRVTDIVRVCAFEREDVETIRRAMGVEAPPESWREYFQQQLETNRPRLLITRWRPPSLSPPSCS